MKNILVTGGAGFIGSNFIKYILDKYSHYNIINVDLLTYAGNMGNLKSLSDNIKYKFIKGDIRDKTVIKEIFKAFSIDSVINFAAQSHVDRSIDDPESFLTTNIFGTQVLLDTAKDYWKINKGDKYCTLYKKGVRFIQISTDEVYGSLSVKDKFRESSPLMPNSPYAASKASADMIIMAYQNTYGFPAIITRSSNNYGPYQFPEKFIPLIIINSFSNRSLPIYGDGMQIRDWLHVTDHCNAIDIILHEGKVGQVYNIGGNNERTNIEVVKLILNILNKPESLIKHIKDRPGHDRRYAVDNTKIENELGWKPSYSFEKGIMDTIKWYKENTQWVNSILNNGYTEYYMSMYSESGLYEKV